jgi:hypothetical protein
MAFSFKKMFDNPLSGAAGGAILGLPGMIGGALLGNKNKQNRDIDGQMVNSTAPDMLDENQLPGNPKGLSAYGQIMRRGNLMDASAADASAQAGAMGDVSQARSELAARGGMNSGASERIARAGMAGAGAARQQNAYGLARANMQTDATDMGNQMAWGQRAKLANQQMQGAIHGGNQMANATLNANRPKGLFGLGVLGL